MPAALEQDRVISPPKKKKIDRAAGMQDDAEVQSSIRADCGTRRIDNYGWYGIQFLLQHNGDVGSENGFAADEHGQVTDLTGNNLFIQVIFAKDGKSLPLGVGFGPCENRWIAAGNDSNFGKREFLTAEIVGSSGGTLDLLR